MIKRADYVDFSVKNIEESLLFWTHILGGVLLREGKMSGPIIDEVTGARGLMYEWRYLNWLVLKLNYCNTITLNSQKNLQHPTSLAMLTLRL